MIELRATAAPASVADRLDDLARRADNILGKADNGSKTLSSYLQWATNAARELAPDLRQADLVRLVATRRHDSLQVLNPDSYGSSLIEIVSLELAERASELRVTAAEIRDARGQWGSEQAVVAVLDTNVLLSFHDRLAQIRWDEVFVERRESPIVLAIPMKVVDEIDNLKDRGVKEVQVRARDALKTIDSTIRDPRRSRLIRPARELYDEPPIRLKILLDDLGHSPLPVADAEIVDRALSVAAFADQTWVISNDTGMNIRARAVGLFASRLSRKLLDHLKAD